MLVATITALIVLFSGGYEIFFAENVEKGIKEYVLDKDRRKELLNMTKGIKSDAKAYNKARKANYKDFEALFTSYETSEEELEDFFDNLTGLQRDYQENFVSKRIEVTTELTDEEWKGIVQFSQEAYQKKLDKQAKKKQKDKGVFVKTRKKIAEVEDPDNQKMISEQLDSFLENMVDFNSAMKDVNVLENDLLVEKSNSKEDLLTLYDDMNRIRKEAFKSVMAFHSKTRSLLGQEEGEAILAAFYKDLEITPM